MKKLAALIVCLTTLNLAAQQKDLVDYINPAIGASTSEEAAGSSHGMGKTFPGSATPFGLVQLSPDTKTAGDNGPGYSWHHTTMEGFSMIHMSGIGWYGDLGNFLITPTTGKLHTSKGNDDTPENGYRSHYSHDRETIRAGYYAVTLDDYNIRAELTSQKRAGFLRFTYPKNDMSRVQIDLARRIGGTSNFQSVEVVSNNTIKGWMKCEPSGGGWGHGGGKADYIVYFYCEFSKPFTNYGFWSADIPEGTDRCGGDAINKPEYQELIKNAKIIRGEKSISGRHIGFFNEFPTEENDQLLIRCGVSFVSAEGAEKNLRHDINHWDFKRTENENRDLWRDAIKNITVTGGSDKENTILYTALYHTMIDPRSTSDIDGKYVGADKQIYKTDNFTYRTIFSGWDVFRSQFPLQTLINPQLVNDEINSLISIAEKSGKEYYPRWEMMNAYSGCMIGNPGVSILTEAWNKGIRNYDKNKAFKYALNSVKKFTNDPLGYTPNDISVTLEYAYSDWCMAKLADMMGDKTTATEYYKKSLNYKTIWDDSVAWFRAKDTAGKFRKWNSRIDPSHFCCESNPFQQGWFVPHDIYGLRNHMGADKFDKDLDLFFENAHPKFMWSEYYNHPNEPCHTIPFIFPYTGRPWLTQKWTRAICDRGYGTDVLGLCGNEDVGQMSAWYVLASIGLHPQNPADDIYIITSPVFSTIEIGLDKNYYKGNKFKITAKNNSPENIYIQRAYLNSKEITRAWLKFSEISSGGELVLEMGDKPNVKFGSANKDLPPSNIN